MPETPILHDEVLRRLYAEASRPAEPHPSEQALGLLLAGRLEGEEKERAVEHVARCGECAALVQHVASCAECEAEFGARPVVAPQARHWPVSRAFVTWAAAASVALWLSRGREAPPPRVSASPAQGAVRATLRDGSAAIRLTADGRLEGLTLDDEGLRRELAATLASGALPFPEELQKLRGPRLTLLGSSAGPGLMGLAPVGTVVRSERPTLRWSATPRALNYVASVYLEDLTPAATSGSVHATEWTPTRPLRRGRTYLWQVAAQTAEGRRVWPAPPEPEARFRVIDAETAAALDRALEESRGSWLATGFLLARAGVLDEAEQAFAKLAEANPGSPEAARLREGIRRARLTD